ncbi:hypothetical protein F2Q69_00047430 [Brassica cretica]|uniref:Uncharacterized protein n=1 Tax=Brassica cretica TaxID=69181 RepID=A0A8S9PVI5_BRACR|nr:hypothetical protein F2Q69_00047430 [Brassica cretica]
MVVNLFFPISLIQKGSLCALDWSSLSVVYPTGKAPQGKPVMVPNSWRPNLIGSLPKIDQKGVPENMSDESKKVWLRVNVETSTGEPVGGEKSRRETVVQLVVT